MRAMIFFAAGQGIEMPTSGPAAAEYPDLMGEAITGNAG